MSDKKLLPKGFELKFFHDKKTKTYWVECIDNPEINAISSTTEGLITSLSASIYDYYHISKKEAEKRGPLKYFIVVPQMNILKSIQRKITQCLPASIAPREPQRVSFSSSFPAFLSA